MPLAAPPQASYKPYSCSLNMLLPGGNPSWEPETEEVQSIISLCEKAEGPLPEHVALYIPHNALRSFHLFSFDEEDESHLCFSCGGGYIIDWREGAPTYFNDTSGAYEALEASARKHGCGQFLN